VATLAAQNPAQLTQIEGLQADMAALDARLEDFQAALAGQETAVADLNATFTSTNEALATRTLLLEEGLTAMQSDLITNTSQLDDLGGQIDNARAEVAQLGDLVNDVEQSAATAVVHSSAAISATQVVTQTVGDMQETLLLFRTWELVMRARLRLLESNLGLATADVQAALQAVDLLAEQLPPEQAAALAQAEARFAQSLANLPNNPTGAALDLEQAWDALDELLRLRVALPQQPLAPETAVDSDTPPTDEP
jgi:chromosome segregation ATPase